MVERFQDFKDYAGVKSDSEIMSQLDTQRDGTITYLLKQNLTWSRESGVFSEGDKVQQIRNEVRKTSALD